MPVGIAGSAVSPRRGENPTAWKSAGFRLTTCAASGM